MRLIVAGICICAVALVLLVTLTATALHRARGYADPTYRASAVAEYLWILIPWMIMAAAALPAVRLMASLK
jgi:heme/copper-type cytochrome/quinol oxidase subunit 2